MEKNKAQIEEIKILKLEHKSQAIIICEVTEQKKKVIEDKAMIEDEKRNLTIRLEEKTIKLEVISNVQLNTLS